MGRLLKISEVCERTGLRESTLRAWILRREIEFIKIGRKAVRIPESEIDRLIEEGTVPRRVCEC